MAKVQDVQSKSHDAEHGPQQGQQQGPPYNQEVGLSGLFRVRLGGLVDCNCMLMHPPCVSMDGWILLTLTLAYVALGGSTP